MTDADGICEACGRERTIAGVASVPGFALSITWCHECLRMGVQPLVTLEATVCDDEESLEDAVLRARIAGIPATLDLADWYLEEHVFVDGEYITIRDYLARLYEER